MEELARTVTQSLALLVEMGAAVVIAVGAVTTLYRALPFIFIRRATVIEKKELWLDFAQSLLLGLEFELAADILRTATSPTWSDIGQLASIAAIRTFLGFFLERDIREFRPSSAERG